MKLSVFLFSLFFFPSGPIRSVSAEPFLIEEGIARAEIVIAPDASRSARFGSLELQSYLKKITGANLEIVTSPTRLVPLRIFVGESESARSAGMTSEGLGRDAFRIVSGEDWLALIGNDLDFQPREPWARHHSDWRTNKEKEWDELAGYSWRNPVGSNLYRNYNRELDIWNFDYRGSLNAVYELLRELGVRWYMPGELGEILPETKSVVLGEWNREVSPSYEVRTLSRPLISSGEVEDALWYLRIGANHQYGVLHHGLRYLTEHPEQRAAHPEYFSMMANGERDNVSKTANACLSSEGFFEELVAYAKIMFDHYEVPILSVMPHDGFNHCQCELCQHQETPERGPSGASSDYVWNFVVRVANELAKTHPDRKIFCGAYSRYRMPPLTIETLPDNVWVQITNGRPIREVADDVHESTTALREEWLEKTSNPLSLTLNYTPLTDRGAIRPQYWAGVAARGIQASHEDIWREDVWLSNGKGGLHHPSMSHLNPYVISRFWWDAEQDVDTLLAEYYQLFYGPAAGEMQEFIEFCETEYDSLSSDPKIGGKAISLFDIALGKAPVGSVFAQRMAPVGEFLVTLRARLEQLRVPRPEGLPEYRIIDMSSDKWRDARGTFSLDGKLDEPFWTAYPYPRQLKEFRAARKPSHGARFMARWWQGNLYFGIHCELPPGEAPLIGSDKNDDPAIWQGEHLELVFQTDKHSHYQIVVSPTGATIDLDRGVDKAKWFDWSSESEVATHLGEGFWSVELKLPIRESEEDPLHQIVGSRPFESPQRAFDEGKGVSLPWYFNLYRKRPGTSDEEVTSFSPIGFEAKDFHETLQFSKFYVR